MRVIGVFASIFFVAAMLSAPAMGTDTSSRATAVPGSLNYVEGQASIGSQALNSKSIGSAELQAGQTLTTENGKVEVLLTPGVFLRVGNDSAVKMISPSITNTEIALERGQAIVEVDEIHPENNLRIAANGAITALLKTGLYNFDGKTALLQVYEGKASVLEGDRHATVKGGHEINLNQNDKLKAAKFDKKEYESGDLYRWSSLRSSYVAEANIDAAGLYAMNGYGPWGPGWWGAAWYWDPWFDAFTFIPGDGIFFSPFGWGFYSPWWVYDAPFFGFWYGSGYHPVVHHFNTNYHNWGPGAHYVASATYSHGIYRGPGSMGAFRSGPRMMTGAQGFGRAGAGGIHRGGFHDGGGFHSSGSSNSGFHGGGGSHGR